MFEGTSSLLKARPLNKYETAFPFLDILTTSAGKDEDARLCNWRSLDAANEAVV